MSVNVYLKNQLRRLRRPIPFDFGKLRVKGRNVLGNIVTKNQVERIARIMPTATGTDAEEASATVSASPAPAETETTPLSPAEQTPAQEAILPPAETTDTGHEQMGFDF